MAACFGLRPAFAFEAPEGVALRSIACSDIYIIAPLIRVVAIMPGKRDHKTILTENRGICKRLMIILLGHIVNDASELRLHH